MTTRLQSVLCSSCGAGINVPPDVDNLSCAHCGTPLAIVRGEGYIAAKLAERVSIAITDSGAATQSELRRMQRQQERLTLQSQIIALEAEERAARAGNQNARTKRQVLEVQQQWNRTVQRLGLVEDSLGVPISYTPKKPYRSVADLRPWWGTVLMLVGLLVMTVGIGDNQGLVILFGIAVAIFGHFSGVILARSQRDSPST